MSYRRPAGLPLRKQQSETAPAAPQITDLQGDSAESYTKRPFVERRRTRRVEQSWPEALESLQRILTGIESETKADATEKRFRAIFEDAPIGIFELSPAGVLLNLNSPMARILGCESTKQALAESADGAITLFHPAHWSSYEQSPDGSDVRGFDLRLRMHDGGAKWIRCHVREVKENDTVVRYEGTAEDVTKRKLLEVHTERLAYYDALTGLPNRTLFQAQLEAELQKAISNKARIGLLLVQIDRFKVINDSLGQRFGDRLLQEIGRRLTIAAGRESIVARIGGAEFALVVENISVDDLPTIAQRVMSKLATEYSFFGYSLNVSCNMGIGSFPKDGTDCDSMMRAAETALCCAREEGLNTYKIFTDAMNEEVQELFRLERGLRDALANEELFLVYQPQVDLRTGQITGLEALIRWKHPQEGLILPGRFIGVAETSGLIVPIGEWVLRTACAQARKWQEAGLPPVPIAVNVSAIQFRQQGFSELIRSILNDSGLRPEYLELELTESLLMSNADVMFSTIQELKEMGVMLAIDDFGTGYSSLGYLRQFKVNRLKIARSFIQDVSVDADDAAITTAIINMAKALNLSVLAEGVENEEQLSFLESQQCFTIQGFYFSKPVAVDEIDQHLRSGFTHFSSPSIH